MQITIASGKGGTGKTTIATSLFLSHENIQLLDADVDEPNCSLFLSISVKEVGEAQILVPEIDYTKCTHCGICSENCEFHSLINLPGQILVFEKICHGCGVCSYLCPEKAISEKPRTIGKIFAGTDKELIFHYGELIVGEELSTPVIAKLKNFIHQEKGLIIIDSPPGSACSMVEAVINSDYVIIVAEPTPFGLSDMQIVVETLRRIKMEFGVIINKDGIGNDELETFCTEEEIPILMKVPFDIEIAQKYSEGKTLAVSSPYWKKKFIELIKKIKGEINND
ncbi:MAG: 4Fe-4S binding protein [Asgard group archaeon]|nr:4Fe-4S binding protein [Asgard group archaeon]